MGQKSPLKMQTLPFSFLVQFSKKNPNPCNVSRFLRFCVFFHLCHNFWTNLDPLSTSKWPSQSQFCERYNVDGQKNGVLEMVVKRPFVSLLLFEVPSFMEFHKNVEKIFFHWFLWLCCEFFYQVSSSKKIIFFKKWYVMARWTILITFKCNGS